MNSMNRLQHFILDPVSKRPLMFLLLTLLFSVPGWLYCWNIYGEYYPLSRLVGWLLFITAMPALMAWACCFIKWRIVRGLIYMATVSLFAINIFLTLNFDTMISPWILLLVHETNSNESSEFLSTYALSTPSIVTYGLTLLSVGLIVIGEKMGRSITIKRPRLMLFPFILWLAVGVWQAVLVIMMFFASTQSQLQAWYEGKAFYCIENTPANLLYSCYHLHLTNHENDAAWEASEKVFQSTVTRDEKDTLDVVLIIGESYNKYHASIYGYYLDTTPTMREQQKRGNLFVFQDAVSPYNMTTLAVKNMLSTNSISLHQSWEEHPLVMTIFRKAGFDVAMWDNQKSENNMLFHDFSNNSLLYGKKMVESTYHHLNNAPFDYDQQLVDTALTVKRKPGSTLTVFHLMGQHTAPIWRYPENDENAIYTADSIQRNDLNDYQRQYIAEYDNATRYNDHVIGSIIQYYRQRNAVILYLSDHGDEVYDYRNVVGRTHEPVKQKQALKYQYEIPMVLWCSDQFIQRHPNTMQNIRRAILRPFSSDNVPQLLMGLSNIHSSFYEPKKDVLSNQYHCGKRIVQNTTDYDAVMKP